MTWSWKEILNHLLLANNANQPGWGATEGGLSVEWWRASGVDVGGWCPEVCLPCFFLQTSNGFLDFQKRSSMVLFRQKKLTLDGRIRKYRILMDFVFLNHWWQNLMSDAWSVYIYILYCICKILYGLDFLYPLAVLWPKRTYQLFWGTEVLWCMILSAHLMDISSKGLLLRWEGPQLWCTLARFFSRKVEQLTVYRSSKTRSNMDPMVEAATLETICSYVCLH